MPTPLVIRSVIWLWLIAALLVGNSGVLSRLPMPAVQGILIALTALLLLAYARLAVVRNWINSLDLRGLVLLHLTRFVGIYFLLMYRRGMLPYDFAVRGGWGDIIVATLVLPVCFLPLAPASRRRAITIWNVIGTLDILFVVATAGRLGLAGDPLMRNLTVLPLSLLPTFLVPIIIATHILIFLRLRSAAAPATS
jgi:hypothetical protein